MAWSYHHIKMLVLLPGRIFAKNIREKILLTIPPVAPTGVLNSRSLSLRKSKWFNPADGHLLLSPDWFGVNTLLYSFVYTILAHTVYTHIIVLAAVFGAICQAGPWDHARTAGPGFWSALRGTG